MGLVKIKYWKGFAGAQVIFGATRVTFWGQLEETYLRKEDGTFYLHSFSPFIDFDRPDFTIIYGKLKYRPIGVFSRGISQLSGVKGSEEDPLTPEIEMIPSGRNFNFAPSIGRANDLTSFEGYFGETNKRIHAELRALVEDVDFLESLENFKGLPRNELTNLVVVGSDEPVGFFIPGSYSNVSHIILYSETNTFTWSLDDFEGFKSLFRNPTFLQFPAFEGETIKIPLRQVHRYIGGSRGGFASFNTHEISYARDPLEEFKAKFKDSQVRSFTYSSRHVRSRTGFLTDSSEEEGTGTAWFKIPGKIEGYSAGKVVFTAMDEISTGGKVEVILPPGLYPVIRGFPEFKRVRVGDEMKIPFIPVDRDRKNLAEPNRNLGFYEILDRGVNVREFDKFFRRLDFLVDNDPEKVIIIREGNELIVKRR